MTIRRYDVIPDKPDYRDKGVFSLPRPLVLPSVVSWGNNLGKVRDQGQEGSCFSFAGVGHREFLFRQYHQNEFGRALGEQLEFSPQYLFFKVHEEEQTLGQDCGAQLRTTVKMLRKWGVCLDESLAYNPSQAWIVPPVDTDEQAGIFKSGAYHRLVTVDDMRSSLASGYAFMAGIAIYSSFEADGWTLGSKIMPMPGGSDQLQGYHAVLFFGYDDTQKVFHVRNSWGAEWCDGGNFMFPYQAAANGDLLTDAWIQHLGKAW